MIQRYDFQTIINDALPPVLRQPDVIQLVNSFLSKTFIDWNNFQLYQDITNDDFYWQSSVGTLEYLINRYLSVNYGSYIEVQNNQFQITYCLDDAVDPSKFIVLDDNVEPQNFYIQDDIYDYNADMIINGFVTTAMYFDINKIIKKNTMPGIVYYYNNFNPYFTLIRITNVTVSDLPTYDSNSNIIGSMPFFNGIHLYSYQQDTTKITVNINFDYNVGLSKNAYYTIQYSDGKNISKIYASGLTFLDNNYTSTSFNVSINKPDNSLVNSEYTLWNIVVNIYDDDDNTTLKDSNSTLYFYIYNNLLKGFDISLIYNGFLGGDRKALWYSWGLFNGSNNIQTGYIWNNNNYKYDALRPLFLSYETVEPGAPYNLNFNFLYNLDNNNRLSISLLYNDLPIITNDNYFYFAIDGNYIVFGFFDPNEHFNYAPNF